MQKNDLTIIYYTANKISDYFFENINKQLLKAANGLPIISVSQKPIDLGKNICVGNMGRSYLNVDKQLLIGAKATTTEYVATAEDDVLYSPEHFEYRPAKDVFAYDVNKWSIFTWEKPENCVFSYLSRRTMTSLIVTRQALINTIEERIVRFSDPTTNAINKWAEPGRRDSSLGVTPVKSERYMSRVPSIVFFHQDALGFKHLGTRKSHGDTRVKKLEPWGSAEEILKLYKPA